MWCRCSRILHWSSQIILDPQGVVLLFIKEYPSCHSLYHMHEIGSISTALEWVLRDSLYFFPYEVKNGALNSICIGAMTARMFLLLGWNFGPISFLRSHCPPKQPV
jgi:hypothetical protein